MLTVSSIRLIVLGLPAVSGTTLDRTLTFFSVAAKRLLFKVGLISELWWL